MRLSFRPDRGFLLSCPVQVSGRDVLGFVRKQEPWMQQMARTARQIQTEAGRAIPSLREWLVEHGTLDFNGVAHPLVFQSKGGFFRIEAGRLWLHPELTEAQLQRVLQELAKRFLPPIVEKEAEERNLRVSRVTIRNQRSRWGSCSSIAGISLNWRLVLLPHVLQRHVILHELAHLVHLNHSAAFWNVLREWDPDLMQAREQLKLWEKQVWRGTNPAGES
jgi:predicted metal-dependent hydrolase